MRLWVFFIAMVLVSGLLVASEDSVPTGLSADQSVDYSNSDLDLNNPNADLNLVDWSARSQAEVPLNRISELRADIIKIEEISDKTRITAEQWAYESNLNKADDLSLYSEARIVVSGKHPGMKVDLISGHARYEDGILTNGDAPHINLNDQHLMGTKISSLLDGGFLLERGTSQGKFEVDGATYDLSSDMMASAQIKSKEEIVLSKGAQMIDTFGTKIIALHDGVQVVRTDNRLAVSGVATVYDKFGNVAQVGTIESGEKGKIHVKYSNRAYTVEDAALQLQAGTLRISDKNIISAESILMLDERQQKQLAQSLKNTFEHNLKLQKMCDATGCSYSGAPSLQGIATAAAQQNGVPASSIQEQTGISETLSIGLAVAGVMAYNQLDAPEQETFTLYKSEQGEFRSIVGYDQRGLSPYLVGGLYDNELQIEPDARSGGVATSISVPVGQEKRVSTSVIFAPGVRDEIASGVGVGRIEARLDLKEQGQVEISYYGSDRQSGYLEYRREVGKIRGTLTVRGGENMDNEVGVKIDLARVFD